VSYEHLTDDALAIRAMDAAQRTDYIEAKALMDELEARSWRRRTERPNEIPPGWLTPTEAARFPVGSLVRLTHDSAQDGERVIGDRIEAGEQAMVAGARMGAAGSVVLTLRTPDGRSQQRVNSEGFEPDGWG
jgi:hypothetical protein